MTEKKTLRLYREARAAYDALPNIATALEVQKLAQALVNISDDYAELLDEADDIMAEP